MIHTTTDLAVNHFTNSARELKALEIGCASCEETLHLAVNGFTVDAVDLVIDETQSVRDIETIRLHRMDILNFELSHYDLVIANLVLPFIPKPSFLLLWENLIDAVKPKGVFAGHFFGTDDWKVIKGHVWSLKNDDIHELLAGLDIVHLKENRITGPNLTGRQVSKHNFEWVASKQ